MSGRDDLAAAREAIMARKRKELGEPPTPEELLAYRDGRLDSAARERLEARIAVHPAAARALADLAAFPDVEPGPGTPVLSEEDVDAGWAALRQRLEALPRPVPAPVRPVRVRQPWSPAGLTIAALLLLSVGLGTGYWAAYRAKAIAGPTGPSRNVQIAELEPATGDGFRASESSTELPETSEALVLVLILPGTEEFSSYTVEIVDRDGARRQSVGGLLPSEMGSIRVSFPRAVFAPGDYRIDLFGVNRTGERTKVARYELRVALTP